jgi:hypothetical protein
VVLLVGYGLAFAWTVLAGGLLVFEDHPGQLYRLSHAIAIGVEPWRLNPGWWAGYAELQFYPPSFSYAGAVLQHVSLGALDLSRTYQVLLWVTFLLPGASVYLLLLRALGSPWLALPGPFLAVTLSGGSRSFTRSPGLVLVHGISPRGKDDPRLREAASLLARAGWAVAVPTVEGLTVLRLRPGDSVSVVAALRALVRDGYQPVAILGISLCAGPALRAASEEIVPGDLLDAVDRVRGEAQALGVRTNGRLVGFETKG